MQGYLGIVGLHGHDVGILQSTDYLEFHGT